MKKILTKFLPLLLLISLISCNQLVVGIEKTFSYWANGATIIGIELPPNTPVDGDGFSSLPSGQDARICFKLNNPQKFEFLMPGDLNAPADIIVFDENVRGKNGGRPKFGEDYSLIQKDSDTLELTYKEEFLLKNEQGKANLNPKIKLYNKKDNRRFAQSYNYKLRANTVPPKPEWVTTGKIQQGTDWYYVLIFKIEGLAHPINIADFLHRDISEVYLTEVGIQKAPIQIKLTNNGFDVSGSQGNLIPADKEIKPLAPTDLTGGGPTSFKPIPAANSDDRKWMLCIKTGVKTGLSLSYKVKVKDLRGLPSEETSGVTNAAKLPVPQISYDSGMAALTSSGVYMGNEPALNNDSSNPTNPILISSCFGNTVVLKAHNDYYPSDVTIEAEVKLSASTPASSDFTGHKGRIQKIGNTTKILLDPIPGVDEIYEVKLKASGSNYTDSDEKTYYYKIKKEVRTGDSSWQILKNAVNLASAEDTIYINGHIKSTSTANNSGEIEVREDINIQGLNGKAGDIIDANKDGATKPDTPHRIFTIKSGKSLNLTGLTLQNGKDIAGGAILAETGSVLTLNNTDIKDSEARGGGGAISTGGTLIINGGSVISGNEAPLLGGAIYNGGILKISGSAKITVKSEKNDVYLPADKVIIVTDALTETYVARITPADNTYTEGREVVKGDGYILNNGDISKFSLTQKPGQTWSLQRDSTLNALVLKKEATEITSWQGLQDAVNAAQPGDTITVKNTLTADGSTSEILINKNLTIKGEGTLAVLDANEKHRIFKVLKGSDEVTLTLKDITLKKGKGTQGAGVHVTGGSLELENVTITECKNNADSGEGGAIYISSSSNGRLWIKGSSKIVQNQAEKGAGIYIYTNSDANIIEGSAEIRGNICQSNGKGGGIYLYKGNLVLQGSAQILNNESSVGADGGGGVYISTAGTLTVKNSCIIQGNKAKNSYGSSITGNGGGIYNSGKLIMEGGEIKENEAKLGGAVYNNGTFKISDSAKITIDLTKNDVYLPTGKVITVTGELTETSVARISPVSPYTAGRQVVKGDPSASPPIDLSSQVSKFKVTDDTDGKKWKINAAGQLELANKTITVTSWKELKKAVKEGEYNTILVNNNLTAAYGTDEENYGTIEITKNMTIKGNNTSSQNVIEINLATFTGVGRNKKHKIFKIKSNAVVKMENLELKNGYSTDSGGGIEIEKGNVTLSKVTIDSCTAKANGGGIAVLRGSLKIENGSLIQNCKSLKDTGSSTTANGGGIFVGGNGNLELNGVRIYENEAKDNGGGIYTKGNTTIVSAIIDENSSTLRGGGIYLVGGTLNMLGGEIKKNTAGQGGGCYFENGIFNISGVAKITPSITPNENAHGQNDVYLSDGKKIKITGPLTADQNKAARITVPDANYSESTQVLDGSTAENANKFKVTKKGSEEWEVKSDGYLKKKN
ncbi:hypothetical protein [Treponema denticola]|uniref:hypothetical protein n=1 Tax=Treponema denticola TaxID=158 RepID=UPI0002B59695|nr:hypothetical protein [Treponema denticola]EMB44176.1 polymorphic outer membrane protein [Treponema denticola AL-2]